MLYTVVLFHSSRYSVFYTPQKKNTTAADIFRPAKYAIFPLYTAKKKISTNIGVKYVEIKCQLDATEVFIADLIACSTCFGHHYAHRQELKEYYTVVAACGISCRGFQVAGLVWS